MTSRPTSTVFFALLIALGACSGVPSTGDADDDMVPRVSYTAATRDNGQCQPEGFAQVNKEKTHLYKIHGEVDYVDVETGEKTDIPLQFLFRGYDDDGMSTDNSIVGINTDTPCEKLKLDIEVQYCLYDTLGSAEERACSELLVFDGDGFAEISVERSDKDKPAYE